MFFLPLRIHLSLCLRHSLCLCLHFSLHLSLRSCLRSFLGLLFCLLFCQRLRLRPCLCFFSVFFFVFFFVSVLVFVLFSVFFLSPSQSSFLSSSLFSSLSFSLLCLYPLISLSFQSFLYQYSSISLPSYFLCLFLLFRLYSVVLLCYNFCNGFPCFCFFTRYRREFICKKLNLLGFHYIFYIYNIFQLS